MEYLPKRMGVWIVPDDQTDLVIATIVQANAGGNYKSLLPRRRQDFHLPLGLLRRHNGVLEKTAGLPENSHAS